MSNNMIRKRGEFCPASLAYGEMYIVAKTNTAAETYVSPQIARTKPIKMYRCVDESKFGVNSDGTINIVPDAVFTDISGTIDTGSTYSGSRSVLYKIETTVPGTEIVSTPYDDDPAITHFDNDQSSFTHIYAYGPNFTRLQLCMMSDLISARVENTSVTNAYYMFGDDDFLEKINFVNFSPATLKDTFKGCATLQLDTSSSNINTSRVIDITNTFSGCSLLHEIPRWLNLRQVEKAPAAFRASGLDYVDFGNVPQHNTSNIKMMDMMFAFSTVSRVHNLDITGYNDTYDLKPFTGCDNLSELTFTGGHWNTPQNIILTELHLDFNGIKNTINSLPTISTTKICNFNGCDGCKTITSAQIQELNTLASSKGWTLSLNPTK